MAWTPQDEARLSAMLAQLEARQALAAPPAEPEPEPSGGGFTKRLGVGILNAPANIWSDIGNLPPNLLNMFRPEDEQLDRWAEPLWQIEQAPATSFGERSADMISGVTEMIGGALLPFGAASKLSKVAGAGPKLAGVIGDVAAGGYLGARDSAREAGLMAGEFGVGGALARAIPATTVPRVLMRMATQAAIPPASAAVRGQDPFTTETAIQSGAQAILGSGARSFMRRNRQPAVVPQSPDTMQQVPDGPPVPTREELAILRPALGPRGVVDDTEIPAELFADPAADIVARVRNMPEGPWYEVSTEYQGVRAVPGEGPYGSRMPLLPRADVEPPTVRLGDVAAEPRPLMRQPTRAEMIRDQMLQPMGTADLPSLRARATATPTIPLREGLRKLRGSETGGVMPQLLTRIGSSAAGGLTGYATSDAETEQERLLAALGGAAAGFALPGAIRQARGFLRNPRAAIAQEQQLGIARPLLRRKVDADEAARKASGAAIPSMGARVRAFVERDVLGPGPETQTAMEKGRGYQQLHTELALEQAKKIEPFWKSATPAQQSAVEAYNRGDGSPASEAVLRGQVGDQAADSIVAMRRIEENLQRTIADVAPDKEELIARTLGIYDTRAYRAFVNPEQWNKDLVANPKLKEDMVRLLESQPEWAGYDRWMIQNAVDEYAQNVLRKAKGKLPETTKGSERIDQHLFTKRKDLSPEVRAFLGEVTNPVEARVLTIGKLLGSASQAKTISELVKLSDDAGNKLAMTQDELQAAVRAAEAKGDVQTAQRLKQYTEIPDVTGFGKIGGMYANREAVNALNAFRENLGSNYQRVLSAVNNFIKESMTVLNPATHSRNWLQVPLQGLVARVYNPLRYGEAIRILSEKRDDWRKMVRLGVAKADFASQELRQGMRDLETMLNPKGGRIGRSLGKARQKIRSAYGLPDSVVRIAAYLEHEPRFMAAGQRRGLVGDALREFAENETLKFVNRYTMNYGAVSNVVKWARNKPLVSPFISYAAEMGRILKNLGEDALSGNPADRAWALANIGQLAALPLIVAKFAEGNLSEKDRKDWQRANRLGQGWERAQIRMPLGREKDGSFRYFNFGPITPAGDYVSMARSLARGDFETLLRQNSFVGVEKTPLINLVAAFIAGEDTFTKQPIEGPSGYARQVAKTLLPPLTPGVGYEAERIGRAFTANAEGQLGVANARTGRRDTPGDAVRGLLGIRTAGLQPKQLLRRLGYERDEEVRRAKARLNQILRTNASPDRKQEARAEFRDEKRRILQRYQERVAG